jgi:hypothetical protein
MFLWNILDSLNQTAQKTIEDSQKRHLQEQQEEREEEDVYSRYLIEKQKHKSKIANQIRIYNDRITLLRFLLIMLPIIGLITIPTIGVSYVIVFGVLYGGVYLILRWLSEKVNEISKLDLNQIFTAYEIKVLQRREIKKQEIARRESEIKIARWHKEQELQKQKQKEEEEQKKRAEFQADVAGAIVTVLAAKVLNKDKVYVKGHYRKKRRK